MPDAAMRRPHPRVEDVSEADVQAFLCSLVGRRFPRLQQLKAGRIKELVIAQRAQAGCALPTRNPTYPKSRAQIISQLAYCGHGSRQQDVVGAEELRRQIGLRAVSVPMGTARPVQRENLDWQWCGHTFVGKHNWRPSGKHCSRYDAARHGKQRFNQDVDHVSEFSRAHDYYYGLELEAKHNWLGGDLKTLNPHHAKDALACKVTLTSTDRYHKEQEALQTKERAKMNLRAFKEDYKASRAWSR